jgi:ketol-acid reductoisomerase
MAGVNIDVIGKGLVLKDNSVDNQTLVKVNDEIRAHLIEEVGQELRAAMQGMQAIASA